MMTPGGKLRGLGGKREDVEEEQISDFLLTGQEKSLSKKGE